MNVGEMEYEDVIKQHQMEYNALIKELRPEYDRKIKKVQVLRTEVYEKYLQRELKKHLQGISINFQIKHWKHHKQPKSNKQFIAAFYGDYEEKEKVINLFHKNGIEVWDIQEKLFEINIVKHTLI
jgi:hypothetical protein